MILPPSEPNLLFREDFRSPATVADNGGVITGSPGFSVAGVEFSGTKYIRYQSSQRLFTFANMTFVFDAFTPTALTGDYRTCVFLPAAQPVFQIGYDKTTDKLFFYRGASVGLSTNAVAQGKHRIYVSCGPGTSSTTFYVDGVANGTIADGISGAQPFDSTSYLTLGGNPGASPKGFGGVMCSVRIYSRAWTAAEVADDYARSTYPEISP